MRERPVRYLLVPPVTLAALLSACGGGASSRAIDPASTRDAAAAGTGADAPVTPAGKPSNDGGGPSAPMAEEGPIAPPLPRPVWRWGPARKDDCTAEGLRQVSAPLRNVPSGTSAQAACQQAPRNVMGIDFARPDRCAGDGNDLRGQWDVPDSSCLSTPPPPPSRGADGPLASTAPLEGFADLHLHLMANLGFGGSVVWGGAYGPPAEVLGPIPSFMKAGHDRTEAFFDGKIGEGLIGLATHAETGFPSFNSWPNRTLATHQQSHEDWLLRAYQGGLRLMVMLAVNSEDMFGRGENDLGLLNAITKVQPVLAPGRTSNDMEALEWQVRETYRMQASIDARHGGPGKGWFRIVRDPEEASAVIAGGRLAVVLGTELQHLFNCDSDRPACSPETIVEGLDRLEAMGVTYVFPIHHKLNQFGGPTQFNVLTNGPTEACHETQEDCSSVGLTPLGKFLVEELTARGMFIDTEHMSWKALDDALAIVEARRYPVMASHVGPFDLKADDWQHEQVRRTDQLRRILGTGGMLGIIYGVGVSEYATSKTAPVRLPMSCGGADHWANAYLYMKDLARGGLRGEAGLITVGSDWNGFASWPSPRYGQDPCQPYTARDGKPIPKPARISYPLAPPPGLVPAAVGGSPPLPQMTTPRRWSYDEEGLMHVGLTPELLEDMRLMGLSLGDLEPLYRSARGVVETWRRARARMVPGDRHQLRWVPDRAFDLMDFEGHRDPARDVLVEAGGSDALAGERLALCRRRRDQRLGVERDGRCQLVEEGGAAPAMAAGPLLAQHSGRCLDVDGESSRDGARVQQYACHGGVNQRWLMRPTGTSAGAQPLFEIVSEGSGKCLAIGGAGTAPGAEATQTTCNGSPNQRWAAVRVGNSFSLRPSSSGLCLAIPDQSRSNNADVRQSACTGAADQLWQIDALRADDHHRLFQTALGGFAWLPAPTEPHVVPVTVTADGQRPICRGVARPRLVGVVTGDSCVGATPDGTPGQTRTFERLYQSR